MADTFCIMPFKKLCVTPEGGLRPCSAFNGRLTDPAGVPLSVFKHSLEEIWNSEDMRGIRRDMLEGKKVSRCWPCYQHDEAGYWSTRTQTNGDWGKGWLNEEQMTASSLKDAASAREFREVAPRLLLLEVGSLCNLKCRMCPAESSSGINRDPVHSPWAGGPYEEIPPGQNWREVDAVVDELFSRAEELRAVRIYGGEPLLIPEVGKFLQRLVDAGVSQQIEVLMNTNATMTKPAWTGLFSSFKRVRLTISIDGFDKLFDYIRYPARWEKLQHNLGFFRKLPNAVVVAGVTVQAYNVLNLVDLFGYFDEIGLPFSGHSLVSPSYLRTQVLPPSIRHLAAERLRAYGNHCRPEHQGFALALAAGIESYGNSFDPDDLYEFLLFTSDLDASRGQSLKDACPELYELIARAREAAAAARTSPSVLNAPTAFKKMGQKIHRIVHLARVANPTGADQSAGGSSAADSRSDVEDGIEGFLDSVTNDQVTGWAWEKKQADQPLQVNVYDGELLLATIRADRYRRDLMKAGKGRGKHGFRYIIPARLKDGHVHIIRATVSTTDFELTGSPMRTPLSALPTVKASPRLP